MKKYLSIVSVFLIGAAPLTRPQLPKLPDYPPPEVVVAEASEKDGSVLVRFWLPMSTPTPRRRTIERNGKKIEATVYSISYNKWSLVDLKVDGKEVQAFDVEGKKIAPKELLKLLAKRTHVALCKDDPPDPYYLHVLRPGTVVFQVPQDKVTRPGPPPGPPPQRLQPKPRLEK